MGEGEAYAGGRRLFTHSFIYSRAVPGDGAASGWAMSRSPARDRAIRSIRARRRRRHTPPARAARRSLTRCPRARCRSRRPPPRRRTRCARSPARRAAPRVVARPRAGRPPPARSSAACSEADKTRDDAPEPANARVASTEVKTRVTVTIARPMGITLEPVTDERKGAIITELVEGGNADALGMLEVGDVLVSCAIPGARERPARPWDLDDRWYATILDELGGEPDADDDRADDRARAARGRRGPTRRHRGREAVLGREARGQAQARAVHLLSERFVFHPPLGFNV